MSALLKLPWVLATLPLVVFAVFISWLIVPSIVGTVVPTVVREVLRALD